MKKHSHWHRIIESISAPLGFFVLALLIIETFLANILISGKLSENNQFIGMLLGVALFVIVTVMVFILVWYKPKNLTFDKESHLKEGEYSSLNQTYNEVKLEKEPLKVSTGRKEFLKIFYQLQYNAMCILYLFKISHGKSKVIPLTIFRELNLNGYDYAIGILNGMQAVELIDFKIHEGAIITTTCSEAVKSNIDGAFDRIFEVLTDEKSISNLKKKIESIHKKFK